MTITSANDIGSLYNVSSKAIQDSLNKSDDTQTQSDVFSSILNAAADNISQTNGYLSDQENEELKLAMGISENTHDLSIAMQKAETALAYTVALRDKLLEAYREIMQMQI